ncbi:esterase/lipase family protein [Roseateles sp. PN1]|uniref:esterase/lipase family protein n=1 Tax=Roseateles sp. PN1 TaxID=3137372 RepID=UPI00313924DA
MRVLFVDGIGGAKIYRGELLRRMAQSGHQIEHFSYLTARHSFSALQAQVAERIRAMAAGGDYALIGYSFGGVLLRAALQQAGPALRQPRHLFLLGSPLRASKLSKSFSRCIAYRMLTGDCGQVAASARRMNAISRPDVPTTCIVGTKSIAGLARLAGHRSRNDGMLSESETCPHAFADAHYLNESHPLLPSHGEAIAIMLERLARIEGRPVGG